MCALIPSHSSKSLILTVRLLPPTNLHCQFGCFDTVCSSVFLFAFFCSLSTLRIPAIAHRFLLRFHHPFPIECTIREEALSSKTPSALAILPVLRLHHFRRPLSALSPSRNCFLVYWGILQRISNGRIGECHRSELN